MPTPRAKQKPDYWKWVAAHQPVDPRGRCAETTKAMASAFPELRRVRGFYVCPLGGRRAHWWLVMPDGEIIDPTGDQFASAGMGEYEEYTGPEPTGHCLDCNALLFNGETFCNDACARATFEFMKLNGNRLVVNGKEV